MAVRLFILLQVLRLPLRDGEPIHETPAQAHG